MNKVDVNNLKGVFDYVGSEEIIRNKIRQTLRENFELYGYMPCDSSILYNYDLLAYKYDNDAEILNEMYTLTDQGNRHLALRYDLTMPFCKIISASKGLRLPFKRYEMGKVFRNGPVKPGRNREFYQCDIDVVGIDNRYIELEQMQLVVDVFNSLGIDIIIKWNNRKLMTGLLKELNIDTSKHEKCILVLDKIEKITRDELIKEFINIGLTESESTNLIKLFNLSVEEYNNRFKDTNNEILKEGLEEVNDINNSIITLGLSDNTMFTPSLARGLSIYTGIVFEFFDKKKRLTCSLGGGGRYNKIITEFINDGNIYPAVGLSFGLEPIYAILNTETSKSSLTTVYIVPMDTETESLEIARVLRKNGISVEVELNKRKVKKCFEYASKENIKYVLVVGSLELQDNLYTLKDMEKMEQYKLSLEEIIDKVKKP